MTRAAAAFATAAVFVATAATCGPATASPAHGRAAIFVANAEGGTVSVVDERRLDVVHEIDVLPDGPDATLGEDDPFQSLLGQRIVELAGGANYAQDQDVSPDGRTLYVSRGHRGDVAAFRIRTGELLWKTPVPGLRADHATLSDDGRRLFVSALTEDRVHAIETRRGRRVASFTTGEWPHDNHLSHDGERLYNGSIGNIVTPTELRDARSGTYELTVADAASLEVLRRHEFEAGIRPFAITEDGRRMYAQLSELHGVIAYDLRRGRERRRLALPVDPGVTEEDYDFEAPHHGLAMSRDERTLCLAGRASDYVALVEARPLEPRAIIEVDDAPGWATTGSRGRHCFVPNTRADTLSVISYAKRREVERLRVGDGPKHIEAARVPARVLRG